MHTTNLRKVGGSVMLAVPPALLDILDLQPGAPVGITIQTGRIIVEPHPRRRYTLKELLSQCNPKSTRSREERKWLIGKQVGRELI
jgi:antitoxin ChpS